MSAHSCPCSALSTCDRDMLGPCNLAFAPSKESFSAVPAHMPAASQAPVDLRWSAQVQSRAAQEPASDLAMSLSPSAGWADAALTLGPPWMCRYGVGKWRLIQKDEDYGPILTNRSNVDLKVSARRCVIQVQCRWAGSHTA